MHTELIISTFNKPKHLKLLIDSLYLQKVLPDTVCFADDGSDSRTHELIKNIKYNHNKFYVRHEWQKNRGFRKNLILNKSILTSNADYIIFIDGDCVMHPNFIQRHLSMAQEGVFLSGSVIRLSTHFSKYILKNGKIELDNKSRLVGWNPETLSDKLKSMPIGPNLMGILDKITPIKCSWSGGNASTFRKHIISVNGFDTKMYYGGEDKEFGVRLINARIKGKHLRYTAPLYHIDHGRSYINIKQIEKNREIINAHRRNGIIKTKNGLL